VSSRLSQDLSQSQELTVTAATSGFSQSASKAVAADQLITASIDFSGLDEQYKGTENREKVRKLDIKQFTHHYFSILVLLLPSLKSCGL
jgi:hypothetical protein